MSVLMAFPKPALVLCAALSVVLSVAQWTGSAAARAGERVPEKEIEKSLSGVTLDGIYNNGAFFSETYNEDGSVRYHDIDGSDSGQWSVQAGKFCTFYESQQGACFFVERDGPNCFTFFVPDEKGGPNAGPAKEWTSRGWDRRKPSTCPTAPEIRL
ncbi:hypothetical protein K32_39930 [Kaistia sp. 32K]|uniref:hypothetical protein n=1 Tax=Kaistia sp. 32K TaxID=2795690 RepID=UPI001915B4E7|nr:hypothetical protein [Kaistia sp. 32K]BCP55376.1 hypothetical protein K32_39930 [Kaistia sp. 32K]